MGNWCPSSNLAETTTRGSNRTVYSKDERSNFRSQVDLWINSMPTLSAAQKATQTKHGLRILPPSRIMLSNNEVEVIRDDKNASDDVRLIMNPPFSEVSRITDKLYLSGVAGLTTDNVANLNISLIVNVTYEMPLIIKHGLASVRVPVDDNAEDEIFIYLSDICDLIHRAAHEGHRSMVHCVAGASRSATVVIAYLVKHQNISLKEAFCYVHACRQCARPNMGFFKQLISFENHIRRSTSVKMIDYDINGGKVRVPNFYKFEYPELFVAETIKQLRQPCESAVKDTKTSEVCSTAKGKTSTKQMPTSQAKQQKILLKEAYDEINQIRIRSCVVSKI